MPISPSKFFFAPSISTAEIPILIITGSLFGLIKFNAIFCAPFIPFFGGDCKTSVNLCDVLIVKNNRWSVAQASEKRYPVNSVSEILLIFASKTLSLCNKSKITNWFSADGKLYLCIPLLLETVNSTSIFESSKYTL